MKDKRMREYHYYYNVCDNNGVLLSKEDIKIHYLQTIKIDKDEKTEFEDDERVVIARTTTRIVKVLGRQGDLFRQNSNAM